VFLARGYGSASMDAIAKQAGVSKQTVYAHFGGKAALFGAIVQARSDSIADMIPRPGAPVGDPGEALEAIARRFLTIVLSPEAVARFRVVMAESGRFPELARVFYDSGPKRATLALAEFLGRLDESGVLRVPDSQLAAGQFFAMVRGDLFLRNLLGLRQPTDAADVDAVVRHAVGNFIAVHRPSSAAE